MSINKKYVMAGVLATAALAAPLANATNSYADATRTTTARVNFRTGPSTSYSSMEIIEKGETVTYLETSGSWTKVRYNSQEGYIHSAYLSSATTDSSTSTDYSTSEKYVNCSSGLNVRKGPSTSYSRITTLAKNTKVTVIATSNGWSKINAGNVTGYVSNAYLSDSQSSSAETTQQPSTDSNQAATTKYVNVGSSRLNVRSGPSTGYSKVASLEHGAEVTVTSTNNGWAKINSGSVSGHVSNAYLTSNKPSTGVSSSTNTSSSTSTSSSAVISYAKQLLGKPYVWGAQGPNGFDCSGFTYYVFKNAAGITLPRTATAQSGYGRAVSKSNLQPGDLVFFDTVGPNNGGVTHCGIYIGNGQIIHAASGQGRVVINNLNSSYYVNAYVTARRVL